MKIGQPFSKWCWSSWASQKKEKEGKREKKKGKKEEMSLDLSLTHHAKINSKWIADLNVKCKTIKPVGKNLEENLQKLGLREEFFRLDIKNTINKGKKL